MAFTGPFEDRLAIHELIAVYADAISMRDGESWISCWAKDSEWRLPMIPGMEVTKGRDAILATWNDAITPRAGGPSAGAMGPRRPPPCQHQRVPAVQRRRCGAAAA